LLLKFLWGYGSPVACHSARPTYRSAYRNHAGALLRFVSRKAPCNFRRRFGRSPCWRRWPSLWRWHTLNWPGVLLVFFEPFLYSATGRNVSKAARGHTRLLSLSPRRAGGKPHRGGTAWQLWSAPQNVCGGWNRGRPRSSRSALLDGAERSEAAILVQQFDFAETCAREQTELPE
jgi:hypothetical protein